MGAFGEPVCPGDDDLAGYLPLNDAVDVALHFASQFVATDAGTFSSLLQDTRLQAYFVRRLGMALTKVWDFLKRGWPPFVFEMSRPLTRVVKQRIQSITRQLNKYNKINGLMDSAIVLAIRDQLAAIRNPDSVAGEFPISISIIGGTAIAPVLKQNRSL